MLSKVNTASVLGVNAYLISVEADLSKGLPNFITVGLPDNAVKESKERVRAAIKNSGYSFPNKKITINLAPADIKKEGSGLDLSMAIALLKAQELIKISDTEMDNFIFLGELSLDGILRPVRGALSVADLARKEKKTLVLPKENAKEASFVEGVEIIAVENLTEAVNYLNKEIEIEATVSNINNFTTIIENDIDFNEVKGQESTKRALMVAAAGGHNILMIGPPGSGKTMLAKRLPTILPNLTLEEAIEATKIHSVAGTLSSTAGSDHSFITTRPFRSPHHTISDIGLIGGGTNPRPGEVSLSHRGVLFLDEMPEFKKSALEVLRQPVEDGRVVITRALKSIEYLSSFMLVGAMNPCPCGYLGDIKNQCKCTPLIVRRYRNKLSGPVMDRIDIHIEVPRVDFKELSNNRKGESSSDIKEKVNRARDIQLKRFKSLKIHSNSQMSNAHLKKFCELNAESQNILEQAHDRLNLSARAFSKILKLARTIADLDNSETIETPHLAEAIMYRSLDRDDF